MRFAFCSLLFAGLLTAGAGVAVERDGQGRIAVQGGLTYVPDNPFTQNARAAGFDIEQPYALGPAVAATFGYWIDSDFEISIEGGYWHDAYSVRGQTALSLNTECLLATLRWSFLQTGDLWPYLGVSFGYEFNGIGSPFASPWNSWTATGYGEAAMVGIGWDLSSHVGVTAELRYNLDLVQSPYASALNAGGATLMVGIYLRIARTADNSTIPGTP